MKKHLQALVLTMFAALSLVSAWAVSEKPPSDEEIRKKIVGTWILDAKISDTRSITGTATYTADGKCSASVTIITSDKKETIQADSTWKVKDGYSIETVTKSGSKFPPVGFVTRAKILRINDEELVYTTEEGQEITHKRRK